MECQVMMISSKYQNIKWRQQQKYVLVKFFWLVMPYILVLRSFHLTVIIIIIFLLPTNWMHCKCHFRRRRYRLHHLRHFWISFSLFLRYSKVQFHGCPILEQTLCLSFFAAMHIVVGERGGHCACICTSDFCIFFFVRCNGGSYFVPIIYFSAFSFPDVWRIANSLTLAVSVD